MKESQMRTLNWYRFIFSKRIYWALGGVVEEEEKRVEEGGGGVLLVPSARAEAKGSAVVGRVYPRWEQKARV